MTGRITDPLRLAQAILAAPYRPDGGDWSGLDCWGAIEIWFRHRHGIELSDRTDTAPGDLSGVAQGFDRANTHGWIRVPTPRADDLVVMRSVIAHRSGRTIVQFGHVGVLTPHGLLHVEASGGRLEPIKEPHVAKRISACLRHPRLA